VATKKKEIAQGMGQGAASQVGLEQRSRHSILVWIWELCEFHKSDAAFECISFSSKEHIVFTSLSRGTVAS
jgi:hypothetical protein